jgi:hypothetical protein
MRLALPLLLASLAGSAWAADTIDAFGYKWLVPNATEWAVEGAGSGQILKMLVPHPDRQEAPRRPVHYAVAQTAPLADVTIDVEVKAEGPSNLILVYAWQDAAHFDYAHLSPDPPSKAPVHTGIFHVYGGDRVRISNTEGPAALTVPEWIPVHLTYSAATHMCEVTVSGHALPSLRGVDLSLGAGRVGLGSFFHAVQFRNFRMTAK